MAKPKSAPKKQSRGPSRESRANALLTVRNWLQLALLRSEKCEIEEARIAYGMALEQARKLGELRAIMEAISGLLRLASESLDEASVQKWDHELDELMRAHPKEVPAMAWYCKGAIARHKAEPFVAQRLFHRYLRAIRKEASQPKRNPDPLQLLRPEEAYVRGWVMIAVTLQQRGKIRRAEGLAATLLKRFEKDAFRAINGLLYLVLGTIHEKRKDYDGALQLYHKSQASFLSEHNWYYQLYVLLAYARLARLQKNYPQAYLYLDLVENAASAPSFGLLRREVTTERTRLQQDAVDLLIDSRQCVIKTRDRGEIGLGKQYVLVQILEALSSAHSQGGEPMERGLSKAEIIERVWKENYRPEAHDNKLYYNINRLRKLIEPDLKKPQYLLNWKEGYRLAPGLKIQFIGGAQSERKTQ